MQYFIFLPKITLKIIFSIYRPSFQSYKQLSLIYSAEYFPHYILLEHLIPRNNSLLRVITGRAHTLFSDIHLHIGRQSSVYAAIPVTNPLWWDAAHHGCTAPPPPPSRPSTVRRDDRHRAAYVSRHRANTRRGHAIGRRGPDAGDRQDHQGGGKVTPDTWAEIFGSFERINPKRKTNGSFDSCHSSKWLDYKR